MGHQWLPAVLLLVGGAGGGWFAPHEFHEKVDLTLRVHKQHLDALQELKRMHGVQFTIDDLHHVHKGTVNTMREFLDRLRAKGTPKEQGRDRGTRGQAGAAISFAAGRAVASGRGATGDTGAQVIDAIAAALAPLGLRL